MRLISDIKNDLARLSRPDLKSFLKWYFFPRGECFRWVVWLRILQAIRRHKILSIVFGLFVYLIYRHYEYKYGIHVNPNIKIGDGLRIVHGPCNLNAKYIGRNVTIYPGVMVGKNKNDIPTIGNNVCIYTNSVCVSGIEIKDNAIIGALSYVDFDVPANSKIIMGKRK
jgi:serine acetyltransferase